MVSYIKNSIVEQTVFLTLAGAPVTNVTFSDIVVKYKKTGQTSFQTLNVLPTSFLNLGGGFYTLYFNPSETDTSGTFAYQMASALFDNLIFDQFNIIDQSLSLEQQSYFQDNACERTVYLELSGIPANTVLPASVICKIKKSGQINFSVKTLTLENFINLGNGFYTIKFSADDMSRVGSFLYTLDSGSFDNFAYDEFSVLPAPDVTVKDKCVVKGQFVNLAGESASQIKVSAHTVDFPARMGSKIVSGDIVFTFLDFQGKFELPLLRGSTVIIEVPRAAIRHQILIPDTATANLIDLLPTFSIDYSL